MAPVCSIKFCGLRTEDMVRHAVSLGVERIGFVLTKSPRQVDIDTCARLRELVPPTILTHGLFTSESPDYIRSCMQTCRLDIAQIVGHEEDEPFFGELQDVRVLRCYRVRGPETLDLIRAQAQEEFLLDAYVPGIPGGTGQSFDWSLARDAVQSGRVILAGGLTPENVAEAIRVARPFMVDVSGGIEREKGVKDPQRMEAFCRAVRGADA